MINEVKIVMGYFINIPINTDEQVSQYIENINTFINHIDKLYIYKMIDFDLSIFFDRLKCFNNIIYADAIGYGEAEIYKELVCKAKLDNANYVSYIKPGYFYEGDSFNELKKYLITSNTSNLAVITPMPVLACELHDRKAEEFRLIKGCRLLGAMVNLDIYSKTRGIKVEYFQTTYDYDYCIQARLLGYDVMLAQNLPLRNQNYRIIQKKVLFLTLSMYDRDLMDIYYETRNRHFLWDEYKNLDPEYIKIDKKQYRQERQEIINKDKNYKEKLKMMQMGIDDYKKGILGECKN